MKNVARITETHEFGVLVANTDINAGFSIANFPRATALAQNFRYFRAKRCVYRMVPYYNTYQSGGTAVRPSYRLIMNRTGDNTAWTVAEYDAQGSVPKVFVKEITTKYTPNLVQSVQIQPNSAINVYGGNVADSTFVSVGSRPIFNQWLATESFGIYTNIAATPNIPGTLTYNNRPNVMYWGHSVLITVPGSGAINVGVLTCEVEWEFKDPYIKESLQVPDALPPVAPAPAS